MRALEIILSALLVLMPSVLFAQEEPRPLTPEEEEKQFYEAIEDRVEKYASSLDLADWQIFYLDSILVADFKGMKEELKMLSDSKVTNMDLYIIAQDKWTEKTYNAIHKILNEQQWTKYLKMGAARDKKARDKRAQKREVKK